MKAFRLKFKNTCSENWNTMLPDEKGKFCNLCSKTVIDFTGSSHQEILSYLKANKNTCGKMSSNQLKLPVVEREKDFFRIPFSKTTNRIMIAASIGAVALGNAQDKTAVNSPTFRTFVDDKVGNQQMKQSRVDADSISLNVKKEDSLVSFIQLSGNVKSKATDKNLAKVKVTFYGLSNYVSTFTDSTGNFTLNVPEILITETNLISYTFNGVQEITHDEVYEFNQGFESKDILLSKEELSNQQLLLAEHEVFYLGGAFYSTYKPKPLVFVNGEKVPYRKLNKFHRGKKTEINFAGMDSKFIEGHMATQLHGEKAKDGIYLFYNKLSD
jgi:hypothetical protein